MDTSHVAVAKDRAIRRIQGPTIILGSGVYYDYEAPRTTPMSIEDVAWGLAGINRFASQCVSQVTGKRVFYTVAEHCVRMSDIVPPRLAYDALMHELGEAATGVDMTSPLKTICPDYKAVEKRCEATLFAQFGVTMEKPDVIKHFDLVMLATERRDLTPWRGEAWSWLPGIEPMQELIMPWPAEIAAIRFLERYEALRQKGFGNG